MKSRFLRRKPVLIDAHRSQHNFCWYCAGYLPNSFTSVDKNGQKLRVHYGCRVAAEDLIAGKWINELELDRPIG